MIKVLWRSLCHQSHGHRHQRDFSTVGHGGSWSDHQTQPAAGILPGEKQGAIFNNRRTQVTMDKIDGACTRPIPRPPTFLFLSLFVLGFSFSLNTNRPYLQQLEGALCPKHWTSGLFIIQIWTGPTSNSWRSGFA
jgi:hypothetical protein